jgi:BASS family bile acid:Na+ symporter
LSLAVGATLVAVMLGLGLGVALRDVAGVWRHPGRLARVLFGVIVLMPLATIAVIHAFGLPRETAVGFFLMAVAPGAPLSLKRSLSAGGDRAFAPALQISAVTVAVVSLPLWVTLLDRLYSTAADVEALEVVRQVLVAQLVPLGIGIAMRRARPDLADRIRRPVERIGTVLLVATVALILVDAWDVAIDVGVRGVAAITTLTVAGLGIGHLLGGPEPSARTAAAMTTAARNPGLALLVATLNDAAPGVGKAIMAYLLVSIVVLMPYTRWRRRPAPGAPSLASTAE